MSITPSHLRHALNRIAKVSLHPNPLAYKIQLVGATQKYLERGSKSGAIDLPNPTSAAITDGGKDLLAARFKPGSLNITGDEKSTKKDLQGEEHNSKYVAKRRFMSLATFDSMVGYLWEGSGSVVK